MDVHKATGYADNRFVLQRCVRTVRSGTRRTGAVPEKIGITDLLFVQVRNAAYLVGTGALTIDEAVSQYGSLDQ